MKTFPVVCFISVLLFYLIAYNGIGSLRSTPPPQAVVHHEPNLQRIPAINSIDRAVSAVQVEAPVRTSIDVPAAAAAITTSPPPPTAMQLDGSLEAALKLAVPDGQPKFVLATFGNLGVQEPLTNFVKYAQKVRAAIVVGAVDVGVFDLMRSMGTPTYKTPLAYESYQLDGSNSHASGSWKKFAGMRVGEVVKIVHAGYTVLHTDCDVVFLRDPAPCECPVPCTAPAP